MCLVDLEAFTRQGMYIQHQGAASNTLGIDALLAISNNANS